MFYVAKMKWFGMKNSRPANGLGGRRGGFCGGEYIIINRMSCLGHIVIRQSERLNPNAI